MPSGAFRLLQKGQLPGNARQRQMAGIEHPRQFFHQLKTHHQMLIEYARHDPGAKLRLAQNFLRQAFAKTLLLLQVAARSLRLFSLNQIDHKLRVDAFQHPSRAFQ